MKFIQFPHVGLSHRVKTWPLPDDPWPSAYRMLLLTSLPTVCSWASRTMTHTRQCLHIQMQVLVLMSLPPPGREKQLLIQAPGCRKFNASSFIPGLCSFLRFFWFFCYFFDCTPLSAWGRTPRRLGGPIICLFSLFPSRSLVRVSRASIRPSLTYVMNISHRNYL